MITLRKEHNSISNRKKTKKLIYTRQSSCVTARGVPPVRERSNYTQKTPTKKTPQKILKKNVFKNAKKAKKKIQKYFSGEGLGYSGRNPTLRPPPPSKNSRSLGTPPPQELQKFRTRDPPHPDSRTIWWQSFGTTGTPPPQWQTDKVKT